MIGSAVVTMATVLCCLNKLLEKLRYFRVVFFRLIYVLKDLIRQYEILIQYAVQILAIFHNITFFLKNYFYFCFIKILFAVFNVLFVGYSLAKNNFNNTYQYNIISKKKF
jgi:hypothetical protein